MTFEMSNSNRSDVIRLELPATHQYLNVLTDSIGAFLSHLEGMRSDNEVLQKIQLAIHEACTNIVNHSYDGEVGEIVITMTLSYDPRWFAVELLDQGYNSFDMSDAVKPNMDDAQIHGYGLYIIEELMDDMLYIPEPGNNYWRLVKLL